MLLYHISTMPEMSTAQQPEPLPAAAQQSESPSLMSSSPAELLSAEDELLLYLFLQDLAGELRRIRRERKKNQQAK